MNLLTGLVVVEVAHPLTEYAGHILAGLGATVWLIESPGVSPTRNRRPFADGASESRRSIPFLARNLNKKSVLIDRDSAPGLQLLAELIGTADVVLDASTSAFHDLVESSEPRRVVTVTDDLGLGTSSIVGFAASGGLSSSGWPNQPPCNAPSWLALDAAGIYAAGMAIAACFEGRSGDVQYDIPYAEAALAGITPWTRTLHSYGMVVSGQGAASARLGAGPYPIFRCRDGFVRVLTARGRQWEAWLDLLGRPEGLASEEWNDGRFRAANFEVMVAIAADIVVDRTVDDLFKTGQALGLTITPVLALDDVMADEHVRARELFASVDDPDLGRVQLMRQPVRLPNAKPQVPAPGLGQHTAEAAAFVENRMATPTSRHSERGTADGNAAGTREVQLPLSGIRVLEFGVGAVVPEAASMMALLGAEVIKVESRHHLDFLRQLGLNGPGDFNNCPSFNQMNLGVRSLALDMRGEEGRQVARELVARCDVIMENMRGPVMGKWGLDYESVRKIRPDIVYLSSQGLGSGPYGAFQTFGPNLQTFAGVTAVWAHPDDPYPVGSTLNHPDHLAGKQSLVALLAALKRRAVTGEGCYLDCAQFEAAASLIADKFLARQLTNVAVPPLGNRSLDFAPHGCYPCLGEDQWCAIAVETDEQWTVFSQFLGAEVANRTDMRTTDQRLALAEEINALVGEWTRHQAPGEVEDFLRAAGVPVSRVVTGDDLAARDAWHHDGVFQSVPHPTAGARWHTGLPVHERERGWFPVRRAPLLGEHDQEILLAAGFSPERISQLVARETVGY